MPPLLAYSANYSNTHFLSNFVNHAVNSLFLTFPTSPVLLFTYPYKERLFCIWFWVTWIFLKYGCWSPLDFTQVFMPAAQTFYVLPGWGNWDSQCWDPTPTSVLQTFVVTQQLLSFYYFEVLPGIFLLEQESSWI